MHYTHHVYLFYCIPHRSGVPHAAVVPARVLKVRKSTRSVGAGPSTQAADEAATSRAEVSLFLSAFNVC